MAVDVRDPIFRGRGRLSEVKTTFELRGFLFKAGGTSSRPVGLARGHGPVSCSHGLGVLRTALPTGSYVVSLGPDGESSLTFPLSFARATGDKDAFTCCTEGQGQEGGRQGPASGGNTPPSRRLLWTAPRPAGSTRSHSPPPLLRTQMPLLVLPKATGRRVATRASSLLVMTPVRRPTPVASLPRIMAPWPPGPFLMTSEADSFIDVTEGREKEDGSQGPVGHQSRPPASAHGPVRVSEGSITIPFSVLDVIREGPGHIAHGPQNNGLVTYSYYGKGRLRSRLGKSSRGSRREADLRSGRACRRPRAEP
ncbi:receptor-transporting protein 5-like [Eulemur rufifrons]|uniref:receptor-transporting protein 5-like n=1 Tax=Eulemur rufifrons TaxID=859984 RepID=UPI0037442F58